MSDHLARLRGCGLAVATPQGRHMRDEPAVGVDDPCIDDDFAAVVRRAKMAL